MVKDGNQHIFMDKNVAIDKSLLQGRATTLKELLNGLKSNVFKNSPLNSPVTLSTRGKGNEVLTTIYKCGDCEFIHFESGYFNSGCDSGDIIYIDKSEEFGDFITRQELIELIENDMSEFLDNGVIISCSDDDGTYPMTALMKCSDNCHAAHILCNITEVINPN
jgi:hypothetical protein